jgi:hypothetical protein
MELRAQTVKLSDLRGGVEEDIENEDEDEDEDEDEEVGDEDESSD